MFFTKPQDAPVIALSDGDIRKRLRVLFVDDEEIAQIKNLRRQGYNVFHLPDIETVAEIVEQEFHLIFCDIQGVGKQLCPAEEGAGLIRLLKEQVRYATVIAYSAHSYQPGSEHETTIRKVADDVIKKDASLADYVLRIQKHGRQVFSMERCIKVFAAETKMSETEVREEVVKMARKRSTTFSEKLERVRTVTSVAKTAAELIAVLNAIAPLFK